MNGEVVRDGLVFTPRYKIDKNKCTMIATAQEVYQDYLNQKSQAAKIKEVAELKARLDETDYKVIKCYEYQLAGVELPYDIQALHTERQTLRGRINEIEAGMAK